MALPLSAIQQFVHKGKSSDFMTSSFSHRSGAWLLWVHFNVQQDSWPNAMKMWQTSKASLLADRQLQLRLRTHWRSLSANSFPESTTESKVKPNQCSNFATQSCNHHHGPLSRQTSATRMNCAANASLSALSWRIRAVNFGYFAGFKCCHCDHGIRRNNGWNTLVKHQPEQSAVQC